MDANLVQQLSADSGCMRPIRLTPRLVLLACLCTFVLVSTSFFSLQARPPDAFEPQALSAAETIVDTDVSPPSLPPPPPPPSSPLTSLPQRIAPRISVVAIWEGSFPFPALVNFFASFRANAPTVELVWIGIRKDEQDACLDIGQYATLEHEDPSSNIVFRCLTRLEYWTAHREYFCRQWKCSAEERQEVLDVFMERNDMDRNKSLYRIWRGYIFRDFLHSETQWWGWADVDTFMGSFQSQFPWDVASDYDVIIPAHTDSMLYLRGHLGFIQTRAETEFRMNLYDNMRSMDGFIHRHKDAYWCAEEAEFSAFVIRTPSISFLTLPYHLVELGFDARSPATALFASPSGAYALSPSHSPPLPAFPDFPLLALPSAPSSFVPTFSAAGATHPVDLVTGVDRDKWVPAETTTFYEPPPADELGWAAGEEGEGEPVRIVGRGGGFEGGREGVWERFERARPELRVRVLGAADGEVRASLTEGLYIHWMEHKYEHRPTFDSIPARPLLPSEALAAYYTDGMEIWNIDRGELVWRSVLLD
ncbi:hypothetical protein PUNSTDRAFT_146369 [Punctularia strigosozonata HHB-11173 SS5]|uniref:Uncharacterized protein n=1 Tax=Punctularia strigosozonata (strain HHB-11173) TaxID=741275 RepID=R7S2Z2_PUNST|nr:uncharacterized protein PUNSTDRAFT_146369 [Punctularia strigosozonata HHB-11173 SS5]EIN04730.1 hypothetical protein PUNSTDRAFT_146369 [Punctularia strigosozonata HHB-11173 SS5]